MSNNTPNIMLHQNHWQFSEKVVLLKWFAFQITADMHSSRVVFKQCTAVVGGPCLEQCYEKLCWVQKWK